MLQKNSSLVCLVPVLLLAVWSGVVPSRSQTTARPQPVALHEAELLIYLLPEAHQIRSEGMDVGWELQTSPKLNQEDYYTFWVINAKRESAGSVTVGYFAVNKHTADVWSNADEKLVLSTELEGVQRILRRAHYINQETIKKYRGRPTWSASRSR